MINPQQQVGDFLHPLHHLLPGDHHPEAFGEVSLQGLIADVIIEPA
jgi:hypothetical protein